MKNILSFLLIIASLSMPSIAHDGHKDTLDISNAWARETFGRTMSAAAYVTIKNNTHSDDKLVSVSSTIAKMTEIHLSKEEDGMMKMQPVHGGIAIKKGTTLHLKPKSYHVMMMRLEKPLAKGAVFPIVLHFKKAGKVTIFVEVRDIHGKAVKK